MFSESVGLSIVTGQLQFPPPGNEGGGLPRRNAGLFSDGSAGLEIRVLQGFPAVTISSAGTRLRGLVPA